MESEERSKEGGKEGRKALRYGSSIIPRTLKGAVASPDMDNREEKSSNFSFFCNFISPLIMVDLSMNLKRVAPERPMILFRALRSKSVRSVRPLRA